jgi:hypothetical protein
MGFEFHFARHNIFSDYSDDCIQYIPNASSGNAGRDFIAAWRIS